MRTMSWEEIDRDWNGLQKKHRGEIALSVARYCIGHDINDVARHLGYSQKWVQEQLDQAGIHTALGGTDAPVPLTGGRGNVAHDIPEVIRKYGPSEKEEKAEEFKEYVEHYSEEGYSKDVAKRLARAEWAGETAIEKGVIKESKDKRDKKVNRILFPEDEKDTFELQLRQHMAYVEAAARFLDTAKIPFLKRESTREKVASAHAKWLEQIERIRNLHPTFYKVN